MKNILLFSIAIIFLVSCNLKTEPKEIIKVTVHDNFKNGNKYIDSLKGLSIKEGLVGNLSRLRELCELIAKLDSNDADNLSRLSFIYLLDKKYDEALKLLNCSIKLDTSLHLDHNFTLKACLFNELNNADSANFYFNKMLVLTKYNAINLNTMVEAFIIFKMYDKARDYNDLVLKYYPNDEEANIRIAMDLFVKNKSNEAISIMDKLVKNTKNPKVYATRSLFYHNTKKYNLALKDADKAVALSNGEAWIISGRGRTKEKLKDYKGAEQDYKVAISKGDTTALRYYNSLQEEIKKK